MHKHRLHYHIDRSSMNAALGRNPLLVQTESPPRIQEELIDINEALGPVYKKLIKARFRAMNRVNSSWPPNVAVEPIYTHEDQVFHFTDDQPELRAMVAHQATTILFTIFGNLLMIFVILRNNYILRRKRITPADLLMLHMCTSDLLFACITIFPTLMITLTVPQFHGPDILCKFVKFLQVLPMYSSSFLLVAISADRFYAICRPLANIRSGRYNRPVLYAAIAWISAFCCSTPQFFIFGKNVHNDCTGQYSASWQYPTYVIVFNVVVWLLPSTIAGCLYFCVCRAVWRSMAFEKSCGTPSRGNSGKLMGRSASTAGQEEEHQHLTACTSDGQRRQSRLSSANTLVHHSGLRIQREELDRKRIQTVKLTLTIVAANFILWAPFCIISVIDALMPSFLSPVFATYVMFFGNLNSSCNPIIYFVLNKEAVCTALRPLFDRTFQKNDPDSVRLFDGTRPATTGHINNCSPAITRKSTVCNACIERSPNGNPKFSKSDNKCTNNSALATQQLQHKSSDGRINYQYRFHDNLFNDPLKPTNTNRLNICNLDNYRRTGGQTENGSQHRILIGSVSWYH
ncbi:7 transmembrane receptor [Aphelenchoides besseyi]|nr:7 transmembrane receptor [Aphelenchoides besseyi]